MYVYINCVISSVSHRFTHHLQIDSDDVITRDEQIYVLIGAHAKCERSIQAQMTLVKGLCAITDD